MEKEDLIEKYREVFGCKNTGVCWCEVCVGIENIIDDILETIKQKIELE